MNNDLVAINPSDGAMRWKHSTGSVIYSSPAYTAQDSVVVVGSDDSLLYAVHADSMAANYGHTAWTLRLAAAVRSSPAPDGAGNVIACDMSGKVWALGALNTTGVPPEPRNRVMLSASPNPSSGEVLFRTDPDAPRAPIDVYDMSGRRVAVVRGGPDGYRWSARRPGPGRAAPGVYFYRFESGPAAKKLVLLP